MPKARAQNLLLFKLILCLLKNILILNLIKATNLIKDSFFSNDYLINIEKNGINPDNNKTNIDVTKITFLIVFLFILISE